MVATDHAPHTREEKARPYLRAPSGLPLVQHLLPALWALHADGVLTLPQLVEKACHNPALLYGVVDRGHVREGYWADLVLVSETPREVREEDVLSKCGWSPFAGVTFPVTVDLTLVSGRVAWEDGRINDGCRGRRLEFAAG